MRWLLFLSRFAFICGIFFLLTVSLQIKNWAGDEGVTATIVIIGYFFSVFAIPLVNICYLVLLLRGKNLSALPLWLRLANLLFLVLQLAYIIYLNFHNR